MLHNSIVMFSPKTIQPFMYINIHIQRLGQSWQCDQERRDRQFRQIDSINNIQKQPFDLHIELKFDIFGKKY
jgi:hypothetical protein